MGAFQNGEKLLNTSSTFDNFIVIMVSAMMFFPMNGLGNLLRLFLTLALLAIQSFTKGIKMKRNVEVLITIMLCGIVLPVFTTFLVRQSLNLGSWLHEFERIVYYCALIVLIYSCKISHNTIFKICVITLLIHLAIQVLELNGNQTVFDFVTRYYAGGNSKNAHLNLAKTGGIKGFRSGSIYLNPNVYMVIPLSVLGVVLQYNKRHNSIINYVWVAAALYSLLLTGSRTTFIVAVAMIVVYVLSDKKAMFFKVLGLSVVLILLLIYLPTLSENYRVFNVDFSSQGSFSVKYQLLRNYLTKSTVFEWIFGGIATFLNLQTDFEWGHIFTYFGIIGIVWYVMFIKMLGRNKEAFPLQTLCSQLIICLVALTASVVLCMPVFSFFCLIALPEITDEKIKQRISFSFE